MGTFETSINLGINSDGAVYTFDDGRQIEVRQIGDVLVNERLKTLLELQRFSALKSSAAQAIEDDHAV